MKKSIIKITAVIVFSFISFTALAQNAADRKPKIDESNKTTEQDNTPAAVTAPQIVPAAKVLRAEEQPKPIVPGGEFKPMDTNKPLPGNTKTEPAEKNQPAPPLPEVKKAGPPPVVIEQGPSAQYQAKPAPLQVISQKQQ